MCDFAVLPKLKDPPSVSNNVCGNITVTFKKWVEDFDIGNGPIGEYRYGFPCPIPRH